jgi:hypothetical protein
LKNAEGLGMQSIQFTPQEFKRIERMQKQHRQWRLARWLVLFNGVWNTLLCIVLVSLGIQETNRRSDAKRGLLEILNHNSDNQNLREMLNTTIQFLLASQENILGIALLFAFGFVFLIKVSTYFGLVVRDWRGNLNRVLLLKLLEAHQSQTDGNTQTNART